MGASIHPEMKLSIVLDEESVGGNADAELERRFTAVAPAEVMRARKGSQRSNVLSFSVALSAAGEKDDALWNDALTTWLDEKFTETSALIARENDARGNNGDRVLSFSWIEVQFGDGPIIAVRMVDSVIPAAAAGYVERARRLLKDGAFGVDPIDVVRIPACVSIAAQRSDSVAENASVGEATFLDAELNEDEAGEDWPAADPDENNAWEAASAKRDQPSRAEIDDALAEAEAALRRVDDPADASVEERDADAKAPVASVVMESLPVSVPVVDLSGEGCALSDETVPENLDYRIWNVAYTDGTSLRFDSVIGEVILD
ncbi:MAG: hypothetical protein VB027_09925 [Gordonibacter sp.]|nr:hypothetical protein [Gordonibacter sp.]